MCLNIIYNIIKPPIFLFVKVYSRAPNGLWWFIPPEKIIQLSDQRSVGH